MQIPWEDCALLVLQGLTPARSGSGRAPHALPHAPQIVVYGCITTRDADPTVQHQRVTGQLPGLQGDVLGDARAQVPPRPVPLRVPLADGQGLPLEECVASGAALE